MSETKGLFDIREYVPYTLWRLSEDAGYILEERYSEKHKINGEGWRFMAMMASTEPISAKKIGEFLDRDQVQVTRTLNKLLDNGYVNRRTDPKDRRKVILKLSSKGADVYQDIVAMALELEQKILADMSSKDQDKFREILALVGNNVDRMRAGKRLE